LHFRALPDFSKTILQLIWVTSIAEQFLWHNSCITNLVFRCLLRQDLSHEAQHYRVTDNFLSPAL